MTGAPPASSMAAPTDIYGTGGPGLWFPYGHDLARRVSMR